MGKGTFHCPVDSCEVSKRNGTALNNHIRMKAKHNPDGQHSNYYTPPGEEDSSSQESDDSGDKNIIDDMKKENEELANENQDQLEELEPVQSTDQGSSGEWVALEEAELETLQERGFGDSNKETAAMLKQAMNRGNSEVNMETGELR